MVLLLVVGDGLVTVVAAVGGIVAMHARFVARATNGVKALATSFLRYAFAMDSETVFAVSAFVAILAALVNVWLRLPVRVDVDFLVLAELPD